MHYIDLVIDRLTGQEEVRFPVARLFNMGWTIKDEAKQRRHIEEVRNSGVRVPEFKYTPTIFALSNHVATTDTDIQVQRQRTCGEVEFCLLRGGGLDLLGVMSDHTDRELESHWIPWSKQSCSDVISRHVWPMDEVRPHWDDIVMECEVRNAGEDWRPYQWCTLGEFVAPETLWEAIHQRVRGVDESQGVILTSGTVVSHGETLDYADEWKLRLHDPVLKRTIEHPYRVHVLQNDFVDPRENLDD